MQSNYTLYKNKKYFLKINNKYIYYLLDYLEIYNNIFYIKLKDKMNLINNINLLIYYFNNKYYIVEKIYYKKNTFYDINIDTNIDIKIIKKIILKYNEKLCYLFYNFENIYVELCT
jgi:hypothetical protein